MLRYQLRWVSTRLAGGVNLVNRGVNLLNTLNLYLRTIPIEPTPYSPQGGPLAFSELESRLGQRHQPAMAYGVPLSVA